MSFAERSESSAKYSPLSQHGANPPRTKLNSARAAKVGLCDARDRVEEISRVRAAAIPLVAFSSFI